MPESPPEPERLGTTGEPTNRLLQTIREMVAELYPHDAAAPAVSLDSSFDADLGFDSLARAELLARVEQAFHAALPEALFADMETPADLLRALLGSSAPIAAGHGPSPIQSAPPETSPSKLEVPKMPDR